MLQVGRAEAGTRHVLGGRRRRAPQSRRRLLLRLLKRCLLVPGLVKVPPGSVGASSASVQGVAWDDGLFVIRLLLLRLLRSPSKDSWFGHWRRRVMLLLLRLGHLVVSVVPRVDVVV